MKILRHIAMPLAVFCMPLAAHGQELTTGTDWTRASSAERFAYVAAVSDVISTGALYDQKNSSGGGARTFMQRAQEGLNGTTVAQAVQAVDAWYRANPGQLSKPVLSVIWREIAIPRLSGK